MATKKKPKQKVAGKTKKGIKAAKTKAKAKPSAANTSGFEAEHFALTTAALEAIAPPAPGALPAPQATLSLQVHRDASVKTSVEHFFGGQLVEVIPDGDLTSGPAFRKLNPGSNTLVWRGAFIADGTATLTLLLTAPSGVVIKQRVETATRPPIKDVFGLVVL